MLSNTLYFNSLLPPEVIGKQGHSASYTEYSVNFNLKLLQKKCYKWTYSYKQGSLGTIIICFCFPLSGR